jgi:hypothetical protein
MIGAIATIALVLLAGEAAIRLTSGTSRFLLGSGIFGLLLYAGMLMGLGLTTVAASVLSLSIIVLARTAAKPRPRLRYPLAPALIGAIPVAILIYAVGITPLKDYDGRAFWLLKAKAIAHHRSVDNAFFHTQTSINPRNSYPVLVPVIAATAFHTSGELDDHHVRWLYLAFYLAFALEIRRRLTGAYSADIGAWCACLYLWLPQLATDGGGGAASAYNDIILGAFVGCAFFDLAERAAPGRFGLWLAFILLTKNEGLPIAVVLLGLGVVVYGRRLLMAIPGFAAGLFTLLVWKHQAPRTDELDFGNLVWTVPAHSERLVASLGGYAMQIVAFEHWGAFWIAFVLSLGGLLLRRQTHIVLLSVMVMTPMVLLYAAVFAVSGWNLMILRDLAPRTLTHLLGPAIVIIGAGVHEFTRPPRGVAQPHPGEPETGTESDSLAT